MEEDILKYSPTVMFRGTPCMSVYLGLDKGVMGTLITILTFNLLPR